MDRAALRRHVPGPIKRLGSAVLNLADPVSVARARRRHGIAEPIPPRALRAHVGGPGVEFFVSGGRTVAGELEDVLAACGSPLAGFESIYEFGCGSGRVLTRLPASAARLAGSDVDADAIAWLREHHGEIDARVNDPLPPTTFEDDAFDLVYAVSVFTHISEASQDAWLAEISRLLRPGGTAVMTVIEQDVFERFRAGVRPAVTPGQLERMAAADLEAEGIVFVPEEITRWSRWRYPGVEASYGLTFHDAGYIRRHWSRWFDVAEIQTGTINFEQSAVVCKPKGDERSKG
jgi:SAM-dependent methyltransferase